MVSKTTPFLILLIICTAQLIGCGYTATELYPTQYRTISVPYFTNLSTTRGVEFDLRETLVKELEQRTPYKVVSGTGPASTRLTGTVTDVHRQLLSRDRAAGLTQEIEITIKADFEWQDLKTGKVIRQYKGLVGVGQFVPSRAIGEFSDDGNRLATQRLADAMINRMRQDDW